MQHLVHNDAHILLELKFALEGRLQVARGNINAAGQNTTETIVESLDIAWRSASDLFHSRSRTNGEESKVVRSGHARREHLRRDNNVSFAAGRIGILRRVLLVQDQISSDSLDCKKTSDNLLRGGDDVVLDRGPCEVRDNVHISASVTIHRLASRFTLLRVIIDFGRVSIDADRIVSRRGVNSPTLVVYELT